MTVSLTYRPSASRWTQPPAPGTWHGGLKERDSGVKRMGKKHDESRERIKFLWTNWLVREVFVSTMLMAEIRTGRWREGEGGGNLFCFFKLNFLFVFKVASLLSPFILEETSYFDSVKCATSASHCGRARSQSSVNPQLLSLTVKGWDLKALCVLWQYPFKGTVLGRITVTEYQPEPTISTASVYSTPP